jgi:anti-sigma B factor antagonist
MNIEDRKESGRLVIRVAGRLDSATAPRFEERLMSAIHGGEIRIAVNFESLEYISSAGLRVLLKAAREIKTEGGGLALCCMRDYIREVFDLSGFVSIIPVLATEGEALDKVGWGQLT